MFYGLRSGSLKILNWQTGQPVWQDQDRIGHSSRRSELPDEAEFGAVALVVLGLGVGGAYLVDQHRLRAEAQNGQAPFEHRDAERPGPVVAALAVLRVMRPAPVAALVADPAHLTARAHREPHRQG